jgi:hypothetical protein
MSARLLGLAFDAEAPSASAKLVLIKLVDCCDDEGKKIFPAVGTLARAAQCDPRTVQRHIALFCTVGLLRRVRAGGQGRGATSHYEMNLEVLRLIAAKGWAAVSGTVIAGANDDDEEALEPACHAETAELAAVPEDAESAKGDTMPPLTADDRVTPATVKGDTGVTQPLKRIPQELERERVSAGVQGQPYPDAGAHAVSAGLPGDGEPVPDREPVPQIEQFVKAWPTSLADSRAKVESAWGALTLAERRQALAEIPRFLAALKAMGKSYPPAGFTYLSEKRWQQLPTMKAEAASGEIISVKPFSRPWWAMFHRARSGAGNGRLLLQRAEQGREMSFRKAEIDQARPEALKPFPVNGDVAKAYLSGASRAGFHFPKFADDKWIFLPDRESAGQAVDELKRAGGL